MYAISHDGVLAEYLKAVRLPRFFRFRQPLISAPLADPYRSAQEALVRGCVLSPGEEIAVAVGSRGIDGFVPVVKAVLDHVRSCGASCFIVPAMGSHGGATAQGQRAVLQHYGITEELGVPIRSTMEVVQIGRTSSGYPVYLDRAATSAQGIILINRIKPHTDFRGRIESGLTKMIAVGLGNSAGASLVHGLGLFGLCELIPELAASAIKSGEIRGGLALLEDGYHRLAEIVWVNGDDILTREPELLERARMMMPRIPFKKVDMIVVGEMGKEISGTGMDTNVIGRYEIKGLEDPPEPDPEIVVAFRLSSGAQGNGLGIGLADVVTAELIEKIDWEATYANVTTTRFPRRGKIPLVAADEVTAVKLGLYLLGFREKPKVVIVKNTLFLEEMFISEALREEAQSKGTILEDVEVVTEDNRVLIP